MAKCQRTGTEMRNGSGGVSPLSMVILKRMDGWDRFKISKVGGDLGRKICLLMHHSA